MMRRLHNAVLVLIVTAAPAFAQNEPSVPRAIPLPDTMGANFSVADTLTAKSGPGDYDFLVGTWRFTFQARRANGSFSPAFTGHWIFSKKQTDGQGVLIEDHWRADDNESTWDAGTWTYRAYNPERKIWEMQGINTNVGAWQPGCADATFDRGKTWIRDYWTMEVHRISR